MEIGSEWRGWTVAEFLGGGSFGKVYRIEREEFGYKYEAALKVIRIPHSDDEVNTVRHEGMTEDSIDSYFYSVVKGITSELALLSQLSGNSNIVSYEDHSVVRLKNEFGWEIYLRMELVTPLFEYLKGKAVTARDVISLGIDISKALETCEKSKIIHRDIKPDNIFYSKQGTYKLGDFGIARKLDKAAAEMTKVGTFSYMAPEVYKGQPYDHTVDIYSLGIILYQFMNKNRRPFMPPYPDSVTMEDNEQANMKRLSGNDMPVPCAADEKLSGIILKACAYDPRDRYQNAEELRRDLESALEDEDADRIVFSECTEDMTRSISSAGGSSFDETVTMFGTGIAESGRMGPSEESPNEKIEGHAEPSASKENHIDEDVVDQKQTITSSEPVSTDFVSEEVQVAEEGSKAVKPKEESGNAHKKSGKHLFALSAVLIVVIAIVSGFFAYSYYCPEVPEVVGDSEEQAKEKLEKAGFKIGQPKDGAFSDKIEQGYIDSQSINAKKRARRGTVIQVTTSLGVPIEVPPFKNKSLDEAKKEAKKRGLIVRDNKNKNDWHDKIKKGCIISQDHPDKEEVPKGTEIVVVVSDGREPVKVPDVLGKEKSEAVRLIKKAKLKSAVSETESSAYAKGKVCYQSLKADSKAFKGDVLSIAVSTGPPQISRSYSNTRKSSKSGKKRSSSKRGNKKDPSNVK